MEKIKVLFLCIHNSARSQMAEAYLKKFGREKFDVESAGLEKGKLNSYAVKVMAEDGIDISSNLTKDVFTFANEGRLFNYVVTVCDAGSADKCPVFPGVSKKIAWNFEDPSEFKGTETEVLGMTRKVRDQIKRAVMNLIRDFAIGNS